MRAEFDQGIADTPANRVKIAARIEEMSLLGSTINRTRRRDVAEFKVERRPKTAKWMMNAVERAFYDAATQRIEAYAYQHDLNERFLLAQAQRFLASSLPAAYRDWGERTGYLTLDEEGDAPNPGKLPGPLVFALGEVCTDAEVLRALQAKDTKFERLVEWLGDPMRLATGSIEMTFRTDLHGRYEIRSGPLVGSPARRLPRRCQSPY